MAEAVVRLQHDTIDVARLFVDVAPGSYGVRLRHIDSAGAAGPTQDSNVIRWDGQGPALPRFLRPWRASTKPSSSNNGRAS